MVLPLETQQLVTHTHTALHHYHVLLQIPNSLRTSTMHSASPTLLTTGSLTTKRYNTVGTYFYVSTVHNNSLHHTYTILFIQNSLREMMVKMLMGSPHFVRCIRPNDLKTPGDFSPDMVKEQLRYTGVLETTRIRKEVNYKNTDCLQITILSKCDCVTSSLVRI